MTLGTEGGGMGEVREGGGVWCKEEGADRDA